MHGRPWRCARRLRLWSLLRGADRSYIQSQNRRSGPPDRRRFVGKGPSWRAPTPLCWAPASSAPRSRCISPSAGSVSRSSTRRAPGEGTSYGNAGVIEGNTLLPHPFPERMGGGAAGGAQARDRRQLPLLVPAAASRPGCSQYRANSAIERRIRFANLMRPLFARGAAGARGADGRSRARRAICARKAGSRSTAREAAFAATARERALAGEFGLPHDGARPRRRARARAGAGAGISSTPCTGRAPRA